MVSLAGPSVTHSAFGREIPGAGWSLARMAALTVASFGAVALAMIATFALAPATIAADPVAQAPTLYVEDAPFTRNRVVHLVISQYGGPGGLVVERRASNDGATTAGVLTNGVSVEGIVDWELATGPDGPRSIFAQVRFQDGSWSPIGSLSLYLDLSRQSSLYMDLDGSVVLQGTEIADRHTRTVTPGDLIQGRTGLAPDDIRWFVVRDDQLSVTLFVASGVFAPGTYASEAPVGGAPCATACATISNSVSLGACTGNGPFTIHDIAFTADGDLELVDADFRIACSSGVVSGSIRYGSERDTIALDQTSDVLHYGTRTIGARPASRSVSFSNFGSVATTLGTATLTGDGAPDYEVAYDACAGVTLQVGESCAVSMVFRAQEREQRFAALSVPDETARGSRQVRLSGYGQEVVTIALHAAVVPAFGPGPATIVVTTSPADANMAAVLVDGVPVSGGTSVLVPPDSREDSRTVTLQPGRHRIEAIYPTGGWFVAPPPQAITVDVGIATALDLDTVTDDGVAAGESATLRATLAAVVPVQGTLRIRDGATGAVLAARSVSGATTSTTATVTKPIGTHHFTAEFTPAASPIQAAAAALDMAVVSGTRPRTTMSTEPLLTDYSPVFSEFSSPDGGVTFQCRLALSDWYPCTSPGMYSAQPDSVHTLQVRAIRPNGLADRSPAERVWTYDTSLPVVTAPTTVFVAGSTVDDGKAKARIAWTGTDTASGIARFELQSQVDGGSWSTVSTTLTVSHLDQPLAAGHRYAYRVRAVDRIGRVSGWATGTGSWIAVYQDSSSRLTYAGTWSSVSGSPFWAGTTRKSTKPGATASITVTVKSLGWVARRGPDRGKAEVYQDGVLIATVDLYAPELQDRRIVWVRNWPAAKGHTIRIHVIGTSGRPRVDLDAIVTAN